MALRKSVTVGVGKRERCPRWFMVFSNSHATTMANEKKSGREGSRSAGLIERHEEENKRCALARHVLASN